MEHSPALVTLDTVVVLPTLNRPEAIKGKRGELQGPVPACVFSSHYPELLIVLRILYIPTYREHARRSVLC